MNPDQEQLEGEERQIAAAVAELYLSEKIRFCWACIFCGLMLLTWFGGSALSRLARYKASLLAGQPAIAGHERSEQIAELHRLEIRCAEWSGIFCLFLLLFFIASLFAWFAAMELRRRTLVRLALRQRGLLDSPPSP